ncbi:MAG: tetratricopeptide repeat protein [Desulfamplus sp.]|nr:tetratricopeptide repeat protein [Desulfamplus sp.]
MAENDTERVIDEFYCGFKIKPSKDKDSFTRSQYIKILLRITSVMAVMGAILLFLKIIGIIGFILLVFSSTIISGIILFFINTIVDKYFSLIYGGGRANWSLREQLHGDLLRVKYLRRNNDFAEALKILNEILEKKPDHKEALFIKAQILWENLNNYGGAKVCLKKITDSNLLEDEHINEWANNLSQKITLQKKL